MQNFKNYTYRFLAFVVALQILNMSIDAPSAQMPPGRGNDNFNYIDTYVEYIAEVVLKFENAIPESKDRQQKELQQHKQFEIVFEKSSPLLAFLWNEILVDHARDSADKYAYQFVKDINPPPPRAC